MLPIPILPLPPLPIPILTPEPKDPTILVRCTLPDLTLALLTLLDPLVLFQNAALGFSEPALLGLSSDSCGACGVSGSGPLGGVNLFGRVRDHRRERVEDEADEPDLSTVEIEVEVVCTDRRAGLGVGVGVGMGVMERGVTVVPELSSVTVEVCTLGVVLVSIGWHCASVSGCMNVCFLYRGGGWRECECEWEWECGWESVRDRGAVVDGEGAHRSSSLTILRSQAGIPLMLAQVMFEVPPTLLDILPLCMLSVSRCTLDPSGTDDATLGTGESERRIGELLLFVLTPTPLVIPIKLLPTVPKLSSAYSLSRSCPCPLSDKDGERERGVNMPLMVLVVDVEDLEECVWESMAGEILPERLDWRRMEGVGEQESEFGLERGPDLCSVDAGGLGVEDLVCGWERIPSSDRDPLIGDVGGDRGGEDAEMLSDGAGGDIGDVVEDNDA